MKASPTDLHPLLCCASGVYSVLQIIFFPPSSKWAFPSSRPVSKCLFCYATGLVIFSFSYGHNCEFEDYLICSPDDGVPLTSFIGGKFVAPQGLEYSPHDQCLHKSYRFFFSFSRFFLCWALSLWDKDWLEIG